MSAMVNVNMTAFSRKCVILLILGTLTPGCHRSYYRKQADLEAHALIAEKSQHVARPPVTPVRIDIDPRSRMFNPFDLDFQPMPLDDPASHRYMQCVDGRRGYPMWHAAGTTNSVENPEWWNFLPLDEDGVLVLNAENSVQIALLHSPNYQGQLEQLYLSALDVSSERFLFDTQLFAGSGASFSTQGGSGQPDNSSLQLGTRSVSLQRAFATGGSLAASVANNIVWQLSGSSSRATSTVFDFTILQPLLQAAGRDQVLERLTLAERRLLSNVRAFERYRRSFFLNVTIGRGIESTVQRSGGVFGVGLGGFSGLGGGFAGLAGGGGGGFGGGGGGVPQAGGFFGLLQDQLQILNQQENIARLSENLLVLENTLIELLTTIPDDPEEIIRQRLQIAQARSALLAGQQGLLTQQAGYQASLDGFLGTLGLPPYVCARVEDPLLERFELIDRQLRGRREDLIAVRTAVGELNIQLLEQGKIEKDEKTGLPTTTLKWSEGVAASIAQLREEIQPLVDFNEILIQEDLPRIDQDIENFAQAIQKRQSQNTTLKKLYELEQESICTLLNISEVDEVIFEISELPTLKNQLREDFGKLKERLESYDKRLRKLNATLDKYVDLDGDGLDPADLADKVRDDIVLASQNVLADLGDDVLTLQLIQARARTESVILPEVEMDPPTAFQIARRNRRDWANARASLVDSWRLIEFNADNLESTLDLEINGGIGGSTLNPLGLDTDTANLSMGLSWDAPITRLQERNTYRQSLIEYEGAKRNYYQFEDGIWSLLRGQIRQLQSNRLNFELGRQSVRIAAAQIELNEDIRSFRDARGLSSGPTAARDTISALSDLLNAQNSLLNIYVNYEVVRRGLDFDLGTMEITPEGMWIDPGKISAEDLLTRTGASHVHGCGCTKCGLRLHYPPEEQIYGPTYYAEQSEAMIESGQHAPVKIETLSESTEMDDRQAPPVSGMMPLPVQIDENAPPVPMTVPLDDPVLRFGQK